MHTFLHLLSLAGSLGLFLYGMKVMSEGLEKMAGNRMRTVLASITDNRFMGVLTGLGVTALIQSSSATTVMVVSFVNAGLMSLAQAIGVIMGANIGTTVTAWIISAVGFKVNISAMALPILCLGIPLIFSKKGKFKNLGEFLYGFAFLFMGLSFLQSNATDLGVGTMVANLLAQLPCQSFVSILLLVLAGALLTVVVQSSSASMAVTLMLFDMQIPGFGFAQAAALALGQNIGTTITALLASMTANTQARRAALAHTFFNVFGVVIILPVFYPAIHGIEWLVGTLYTGEASNMVLLSTFHTCFNLANTLLLIGFIPQIERFVCWVLPARQEPTVHPLQYISAGLLSTSELSILQAQKEVQLLAQRCHLAFCLVSDLLHASTDEAFRSIAERIAKYEQITDNMEVEIAAYLRRVGEGRLSEESRQHIIRMFRQIDELESIGDSCLRLSLTLSRQRQHGKNTLTPDQVQHMQQMLGLVNESLGYMEENLPHKTPLENGIVQRSVDKEQEINALRNRLKARNLQDLSAGAYSYPLGIVYIDFIAGCERLADYVIHIVETQAARPA